jgi:hypothetical protein
VNGSRKHSSFLQYGNNNSCTTFYGTDPWCKKVAGFKPSILGYSVKCFNTYSNAAGLYDSRLFYLQLPIFHHE